MTLTARQRNLRAAILARDEHACWYCGHHAEQMGWEGEDAMPVCRSCYVTLQRASPDDVPTHATRHDKKHYLDTMRLLRRHIQPQRPFFTTATIKTRYPVLLPKPTNVSPLRQKLLDRQKAKAV